MVSLVLILIAGTIFSSVAATPSSSDTSSATSSGFTQEEVDKILDDIKVASNSGNVEAELDKLIQKAILTDWIKVHLLKLLGG